MNLIRVGKKFEIVIPKNIREKVKIEKGDLLEVEIEGNKIILKKIEYNPYEILKRVVKESYNEEIDEKRAERWLKDASLRHRSSLCLQS